MPHHSRCDVDSQGMAEKGDLRNALDSMDRPLPIGKLLVLTCGAGGLQMFWSTIMANLPILLHDLGISKSLASIVLVSSPLSGCVIAPITGLASDRLRSRWGRRRPVIVVGAFITIVALLLLAYQGAFLRLLTCSHDSCGEYESTVRGLIKGGAVLWTVVMSISIQPMQTGIRSLMIEQAPAEEQNRVSAWATRVAGLTGILSLFASSVHLPAVLHLEDSVTQFQILAMLNCLVIAAVTAITCAHVEEPDTTFSILPATNTESGISILVFQFQESVRGLSERLRSLCKIQFCAWFAWFSLLYGMTTYIGELASPLPQRAHRGAGDGAEAGSFAGMWFAITGLVASFALPLKLEWLLRLLQSRAASSASFYRATYQESRMLRLFLMGSLLWLALLLFAAPVMLSQTAGDILVACCGISWAVAQWIPFAIIGQEIQLSDAKSPGGLQTDRTSRAGVIVGVYGIAASLPQILAGVSNSAVYSAAEALQSSVPTGWTLALGGCVALVAAALARKLP